MRQPEHIAIAGGGIIGLACALLLSDRGRKISLFEAGEAVREASWAAGGMLAVEDPENPAALLPFSRYSRARYPSFLERIEALSGCRVPFRTYQTVQIADPARPNSAGTPLSRDEALSLIPGLADGNHTYLLLEEASLDPRELCTALRTAAAAAGVAIYEYEPVLSVAVAGEASLLTTPRRVLHADAFVNCCGAWAASLLASSPVAPSKGQMLVVAQPAGSRLTRVLRSPEVYLIPRGPFSNNDDGRIVIGATVEDAGYLQAGRARCPLAPAPPRRRAVATRSRCTRARKLGGPPPWHAGRTPLRRPGGRRRWRCAALPRRRTSSQRHPARSRHRACHRRSRLGPNSRDRSCAFLAASRVSIDSM